jgi:hypothetical protein
MTLLNHQTVTIGRGHHASPAFGACVVELASMLAGERFSDHPRSVCPAIAGFLRTYNDLLPEGEQDELYAYAAMIVGTAAPKKVHRARAAHILRWAGLRSRGGGVRPWLRTWDQVLEPAARMAVRLEREERQARVTALLDELVAMDRPDGALGAGPATALPAAPPAAPAAAVRGGRAEG